MKIGEVMTHNVKSATAFDIFSTHTIPDDEAGRSEEREEPSCTRLQRNHMFIRPFPSIQSPLYVTSISANPRPKTESSDLSHQVLKT